MAKATKRTLTKRERQERQEKQRERRQEAAQRRRWARNLGHMLHELAKDPYAADWCECWEPVYNAILDAGRVAFARREDARKQAEEAEANDWLRRQLATLSVAAE